MKNRSNFPEFRQYEDKKVVEENIKDKDVDRLISIIINSEYNDKDVLLGILYRWKSNDFSQGVFDHNYVWNKLGGTLGKAIELKDIYK